jgi:hypothetical protein
MKHFLCIVAGLIIAVSLVASPAALASGTWAVKNAAGKRIGTVRVFAKAHEGGIVARVNNNNGVRRGFLYRKTNGGCMAAMGTPSDTAPRAYLQTRREGDEWSLYSYNDPENADYVGRVERRSNRWYAQTVGDFYHDMGSVPNSAPAWVASGAVFCLHGRWWKWPSYGVTPLTPRRGRAPVGPLSIRSRHSMTASPRL